MRKALVIFGALVSLAFAQTQTVTYTYGGFALPIYPNDWNVWAYANIFVPKSLAITKVTATVQVQFSGVDALNLYLWSPNGTRTKLLERNCPNLQNIDTTFDDSAPTKFADTCPTQAGSGPFRGNEPLANSNGQNSFGYWQVGVENNGNSNTGLMTAVSITITGTTLSPPTIAPKTIVSLATLQNGTVAPGDQILIFGANLGPTEGVRADASKQLPTSLGQTSVTFDGQAAPLFYVSDSFVVVQAPTTLNAGSITSIQVGTPAGSTASISLNVVAAKPGILTYNAGGRGQAKAINQDGSPNGDGSLFSSQKPAAPGSYISFFATGLGPVNPAISAGTPPPTNSLSYTVSPVTVTIAGLPATVSFAGAAPGLTGIYQVNAVVPTNVPSGAVPVVLTTLGSSSQPEATILIQ
jgi:uncharacterized protein (TIGR03437 family)